MKKYIFITLLLLFQTFPPVTKSELNKYDKDNQIFKKEMLQGNISFGKGDYDLALKHYKKARKIRDANPLLKKNTC